jgi:YidC/Oxa1 family membrane protein insertase
MPIWFALYRALTVAAELYHAPFIPGWMDDLTAPDPFHIMPFALMGMMFLQTRLTPSTATGANQKIIMYGMPLMFGVFSFFFPAGLTLYIFTNTCLTAAHHLYLHKDARAEAKEKKAAAAAGGEKKPAESEESETPRKSEASGEASAEQGDKPRPKSKKKRKKKRKR